MMKNIKPTNDVLPHLLSEVTKLYAESQKKEKERWESGDTFNIFNTLGLKTEEVRLHSAFLGELLNPKGSHGASDVFLKAFLEVLGIEEGYIDYDACSLNILERVIGAVTETEGGRIDVIIEDGNHAVIIENKIYAADQCNQLLRYHNYGERMFPNGYKLLYLTLDGHEPTDCSLGSKDFEYKAISYELEILQWLETCLELIPNELPVKIVIRQYVDIIKQLTYTDMDTKYIEELKTLALSPENVLAVGELFKIHGEWFEGLLERYIWKRLDDFAKSRNIKFIQAGGTVYLRREEWNHYAIFIENDRRDDWHKMYIGIRAYNEPGSKNKIYIKDYRPMNCLKCSPSNKYPYPYGWEYLPDILLNWNCHMTEQIVNGEVYNWLVNKLDEILRELEERNLPMP